MKFQALVQSLGVPDAQTSLVSMPDLNPDLIGAASIDGAPSGTIAFIEGRALAAQISETLASALILPQQPDLLAIATQRQIAWIATEQPRLGFAKALTIFYQPWQREPGIHPTAAIDPSVRLGRGVAIGAYATVQAGVVLGDGVCLHDQVAIYPNVWVGDRTVIHAHATIHERSQIGSDCVIQSGVVIGGEGFGFVPTASGWVKMPQSGHVVLEDAVEVGSNSTIDRPSVGETRIGRGTKIDNLVQVGHGCQIGQHCVLVSQVGLAGGVRLGDRAVLAGQVGVAEKVEISAGAIVTAQSGVIQDVGPGDIVSGTPAMPNKLWLRTSLLLRRLPELFQKGS